MAPESSYTPSTELSQKIRRKRTSQLKNPRTVSCNHQFNQHYWTHCYICWNKCMLGYGKNSTSRAVTAPSETKNGAVKVSL